LYGITASITVRGPVTSFWAGLTRVTRHLEKDFRGWTPEVNFFDINPRAKKRKPILVRHADEDAGDVRNILDFQKRYPDVRQVRLEENFRSTEGVVETAAMPAGVKSELLSVR
jgi:hypothetical protein